MSLLWNIAKGVGSLVGKAVATGAWEGAKIAKNCGTSVVKGSVEGAKMGAKALGDAAKDVISNK